jgi:hypothetical protein
MYLSLLGMTWKRRSLSLNPNSENRQWKHLAEA